MSAKSVQTRRVAALTLALLLGGFLIYVAAAGQRGPLERQAASNSISTTSSITLDNSRCADCHRQIFDEWQKDIHAAAWTDEDFRQFSEGYNRVECLTCHAPQPMLDVGIAQAPLVRTAARESGVDCVTCHVQNGKSCGTLGSGAACGGVLVPALKTSQACFHCHSAHNLFKEYEASEQFKRGMTCQECHMEKVSRAVATGGPARDTRRHVFHAGGHDAEGLKKALTLELRAEKGELVVTVTNVGAAHGVPGEINNRSVNLVVSIVHDIDGGKIEEVAAHRERFRAPPRLARDKVPSTQIMPGVPRVLRYPLPIEHGRVEAFVTYQLEFNSIGHEGAEMVRERISF